jgi:cytochrome c oxidase assembly protein subunit 15
MVDWHPLMDAIPPTSDAQWQALFERYKEFPQYQLVNGWMDVHSFKRIFFWEYLHRLFGRLIGLAVFVPWLYFVLTRRLSRRANWGTLFAIFLGAAQGLLGWYMVQSGLVDVPAVSHFRLAAHLVLALLCSQWVLWMTLDLRAPWSHASSPKQAAGSPIRPSALGGSLRIPLALLGLLYLQIVYGAFVAGRRAGYMSSTFPDMNGHYLPGAFFTSPSLVDDLFHNPLTIHYLHRALGALTLLAFVVAAAHLWKKGPLVADRQLGLALGAMVLLQFALGVTTVVFGVPLVPAVVHQGGAVVLLALTTALVHRASRLAPATQLPSGTRI